MISILGADARSLTREQKWDLLGPHIQQNGREALSYATLQEGMEYFIADAGYIAFTTAVHRVFAPKPKRIVLADPVCDEDRLPELVDAFLGAHPRAVFAMASERCAALLRTRGFRANCVGYEPELPVQVYNTKGNWKELDMIKRARNEARRNQISIREVEIETISQADLKEVSRQWMDGKKVSDREIWVYARRPVYQRENGVRKFLAFDKDDLPVGYVFYDPMYRQGRVYGYSANTVRCDEQNYSRLATAIHMQAMDVFREEGVETLNLCLCPFTNIEEGCFSDDAATRLFFKISRRYGGEIYNFDGLSFHKSKYRGTKRLLYYASNSAIPANDIYLAFLTSDIATSYWSTMAKLGLGIAKGLFASGARRRRGVPRIAGLERESTRRRSETCRLAPPRPHSLRWLGRQGQLNSRRVEPHECRR